MGARSIVVGSSEHATEQVLPEMLRALSSAFPGATTRFEIGRSTALTDAVAKGTVARGSARDRHGELAHGLPSWVGS